MSTKRKLGKIIIPLDIRPFPLSHELRSARALAGVGFRVEFLNPDNRKGSKTPDVKLNGLEYEIKSPLGGKGAVERNLKRATKQCNRIVFDCRRMKINDSKVVLDEIRRRLSRQTMIDELLFIDRHGRVIDVFTGKLI